MVVLNRIYTRTGDAGTTALVTGERRPKYDLRVSSYGTVDETNATIGLARLHTAGVEPLDAMLGRIQNDLFDLGADLATPESDEPPAWEPLRIVAAQVTRLEGEIDTLNADLEPLRSFVLPAVRRRPPTSISRARSAGVPSGWRWSWPRTSASGSIRRW